MLTQSALNYRKDIDALRGVAVLLVIFNHLRLIIVPAGFIGVDIFFVISGFLITQKITTRLHNNTFSITEFYLHRMRRILPALITVSFFTTVTAWLLLLPDDLKNYTDSLFATLFSVSNIYFWRTISIEYFSTNAQVIPLLHTWSLGIEEQFYIFWPLLLTIQFYFLAKIIPSFSKRYMYIALITLGLAGSSLSLYCCTGHHPNFNYYSPITRAFELLCGALLVFIPQQTVQKTPTLWHHKTFNVLSIIALSAIIISACMLHDKDFPGLKILIPLAGAATLIYIGQYDPLPIGNRWLANKYLIFIGLISYSLYLWHWPIIAFLNYFMIPLTLHIDIAILILSIFIAYLTWRFIECPFRKKYTYTLLQTTIKFLILPWCCVLIFHIPVKLFPTFGYNKVMTPFLEGEAGYYGILKKEYGCIDNPEGAKILPKEKLCSIGDLSPSSSCQALLIGDSHAAGLVGMLDVMLNQSHCKAYVITQSGSPFLRGKIPDWRENLPMTRNKVIEKLIAYPDYRYVIMGGFWNYYKNLQSTTSISKKPYAALEYGLKNAIAFIIKKQKIPVIFLDNAPLMRLKLSCGLTKITSKNCYNLRQDVAKEQQITRNIIMHLKKQFTQLIVIDPNKVLCDKNYCYSSLDHIALYSSDGFNAHLSYAGSKLIGEQYLKKWSNPFMPQWAKRSQKKSHHL